MTLSERIALLKAGECSNALVRWRKACETAETVTVGFACHGVDLTPASLQDPNWPGGVYTPRWAR